MGIIPLTFAKEHTMSHLIRTTITGVESTFKRVFNILDVNLESIEKLSTAGNLFTDSAVAHATSVNDDLMYEIELTRAARKAERPTNK